MANFKEGDVVKLKSGGPTMTVRYTEQLDDGSTLVVCDYFDDKQNEKSGSYRAGMLDIY